MTLFQRALNTYLRCNKGAKVREMWIIYFRPVWTRDGYHLWSKTVWSSWMHLRELRCPK